MVYKTTVILIPFLILLTSCKTVKHNDIVGEYELLVDFPYRASVGKIILENDNHFEFVHSWELISLKSEGIWSIKNNKVVLNSYKNYKSDYFTVEEKKIDGTGYIQIIDKDNYTINGISISINGSEMMEVTNSEGKVFADEIQRRNIKYVEFFWLGISNGYYKIENKNTNCLIIKVFENEYDEIYFENEKLDVGDKYIEFRENKFVKQ